MANIPKAKFVISKNKALEQYKKINEIADTVSYSSKTNPDITPIMEDNTNCLFSVHISNELKNIKDKSRVLFLAQAWDEEQISQLVGLGVFRFVVDNVSDLDVLLSFLKQSENVGIKIELMLRSKLKENTMRTERHFVFGIPCETVNKKILELKNRPNISSLGIHFHRKTQNMAEWNLCYEVSNMFSEETLQAIDVLNIGGGFPSIYANTNVDVSKSVFRRINELKVFMKEKNIFLMLEPGRFIAAPAGKLITHITAIYENNIVVNASVYNTDMDALIVPVKLLIENEFDKNDETVKSGKAQPYVVKGCTPCSVDLFRYRVYLKNPQVGDQLVFVNAGAYNFASDFCDLEKLETEIVENFENETC
jgi:ornithine decarboxylase